MRAFLPLIALLSMGIAESLPAAERVILREPASVGAEVVAGGFWLRLGGLKEVGLQREGEQMIWKTRAQSVILNQFPLVDLTAPGARIALKLKAKFYGTFSRHSFQLGLFNSSGEQVPGDKPESVALAAFLPFTGYFAAFTLSGEESQGMVLYKRKPDQSAPDANLLFSMNTMNVSYLKGGAGYASQPEEEMEFLIAIEQIGGRVDISVSVNGLSLHASDDAPVTSFDTVALRCFGGGMEEIVISECEVAH